MKMISSTSMTSMNGTMLISLIVRRREPRWRTAGISRVAVTAGGAGTGAGIAPALRCRMFENSSMKLSSWLAMRSMSRAKRL